MNKEGGGVTMRAEKTEAGWHWEYIACNWVQVPEERSSELSLSQRLKEGDL